MSRIDLSGSRGRGRQENPSLTSSLSAGSSRWMDLPVNNSANQRPSGNIAASSFMRSSGDLHMLSREGSQPVGGGFSRGASRSVKPGEDRAKLSAKLSDNSSGRLSYAQVRTAGGPQESLGSGTDHWTSAGRSGQAVSRMFSIHRDELSDPTTQPQRSSSIAETARKTGGIGKLLREVGGGAADRADREPAAAAPAQHDRRAVTAYDEDEQAYGNGAAEDMQEYADWQEVEEEEGEEEQRIHDGVSQAVWRMRESRVSTHHPVCTRTARERRAYTTSDDWAIFALHSQYVRPLRDRDWLPGEPCIIRKGSFELPPGAARYSESSSGLPATAFDSFVFPNPPRQFLLAAKGSVGGGDGGQPIGCFRAGRGRQAADRRRNLQLTQGQLLDLERMLWFDPEPRLERPFRLYADSKGCLKVGVVHAASVISSDLCCRREDS
ncbi:hypothetical protein Efla_003120 [Eimeria flavescens]